MRLNLILLLTLFHINISQSQNLYLKASTGYHFGSNRSNFENYLNNKWVSITFPYEIDRYTYSLGKGTDFGLSLGYTTKRRIGFELEGSYLLGLKTIGKSEYGVNNIFQKEIWGRFYRICPSIHFVQPMTKCSLKMTLGGLVGFGRMYLNQKATYKDVTWFNYENEFTGGYYMGFRVGIGVLIPLNERLNLSVDADWIEAHFSPGRSTITKYMSGNNDYTDQMSIGEREINYFSSLEYRPYDPGQPSQALKKKFAANSIGLQVGIQWSLWKKAVKDNEI